MHLPPLTLLAFGAGTDLLAALRSNDAVGMMCVTLVIILSVASVTIMFHKTRAVLAAERASKAFYRLCMQRHGGADEVFLATRDHENSPLAVLARETYVECEAESWFRPSDHAPNSADIEMTRSILETAIDRVVCAEQHRLEKGLYFLALAASLGPLIGLFGTVWGILGAFQALGAEGATLASLAPGLSTALVTTIFGLGVAIPSNIAYNILTGKIQGIVSQMDAFSNELMSLLLREISRRNSIAA